MTLSDLCSTPDALLSVSVKGANAVPGLLSGRPLIMTSLESANSKGSASVPDEASTLGDWDDREERRLVRKIDARCLVSRSPTLLAVVTKPRSYSPR